MLQVEVGDREGLLPKEAMWYLHQGESPAPSNPASGMFGVYEYKELNWGHLFLAPTMQSKGVGFGTRILKSILKEPRKFWEKKCDEVHFTQVPIKR